MLGEEDLLSAMTSAWLASESAGGQPMAVVFHPPGQLQVYPFVGPGRALVAVVTHIKTSGGGEGGACSVVAGYTAGPDLAGLGEGERGGRGKS